MERRSTNHLLDPAETPFQVLVETAPNAIVGVDGDGRIVLVNSQAESLFRYSAHELLGQPLELLVPERFQGHAGKRSSYARRPAIRAMGAERELYARRKDGSEFPVEISLGPARTPDGGLLVQAVIVDITERKHAEGELRRQAARQAAIAAFGERALEGAEVEDLMSHAVALVTGHLDVGLVRVLEVDERHGFVTGEAVGFQPSSESASVPGHGSVAALALTAEGPVLVEDLPSDTRFTVGPLHEHGVVAGCVVRIAGRETPVGVLGAFSRFPRRFAPDEVTFLQAVANVLGDAIAHRRSEERIRHQALHDPLTGLANRALFIDRLEHWLAGAPRTPGALSAVAFIDLDHFKVVNDSLGHGTGDELLRAIAPRVIAAVRPGDTVARFGGDEFVVLLEDVASEADALTIAGRVHDSFEAPFQVAGSRHTITPSIGVALSGHPRLPAETIVRNADAAMYKAKALGRARLEAFRQEMHDRVSRRLALEHELRGALAEDALHVVYQPVVSMSDGRVQGFEALVRWRRSDGVMVPPSEFIPVAEESGLIGPLGVWVLEAATRQTAAWRRAHGRAARVSVNLSPRQAAEPSIVATVAEILERTKLTPAALSLEITETVLMEDTEASLAILASLRGLGVSLVLDDFGTGYSSLSHVKRFPIDTIKIDRLFVDGIEHDRGSRAIVAAVVQMARELGVAVVAEGVETTDQAEVVAGLGCSLAQGYLFSRPLAAWDVDGVLAAGTTGALAA